MKLNALIGFLKRCICLNIKIDITEIKYPLNPESSRHMYSRDLWCFSEQVSQIYIFNLIVNSFRGAQWRLLSGFKGESKMICYRLRYQDTISY